MAAKKSKKSMADLVDILPDVPVAPQIVPVVSIEMAQQDILDMLSFHKDAIAKARELSKAVALRKRMENEIGMDNPELPGALSLAKSLEQALYRSGPVNGVYLPALPENHPWWAKYHALQDAIKSKMDEYYGPVNAQIAALEGEMEALGYFAYLKTIKEAAYAS